MVRGVRRLPVHEAPPRRPLDRAARRIGWLGDGRDEVFSACARTLFRMGVARYGALDYHWRLVGRPARARNMRREKPAREEYP